MSARAVRMAIAGTLVATAGALACAGRRDGRAPGADDAARVAMATVRAEGRVTTAPGALVDVGTEVGGRVVAVHVREGDTVARGAVLVSLDDAEERAALAEARARHDECEATLAFLERQWVRVDSLERGGHASVQDLDAATRDRATARAQLAAATATVERLSAALAKRRLLAPISGRIVARAVDPGQIVPAGTPLITIADLARRRVEAEVDESDIAHVRPGAPVAITAEGYDDSSWQGRVTRIPDEVVPRRLRPEDPSRPSDMRVLLVKVALPAAAPFKLGQRVELRIDGR